MAAALPDRARDAQVRGAIRHLRQLRANAARRQKCGVDIPPRARSRESCEANSGAAESLGDVSRDVDANEVKRDSGCLRLTECSEPVTDLLPARSEVVLQHSDVLAHT